MSEELRSTQDKAIRNETFLDLILKKGNSRSEPYPFSYFVIHNMDGCNIIARRNWLDGTSFRGVAVHNFARLSCLVVSRMDYCIGEA